MRHETKRSVESMLRWRSYAEKEQDALQEIINNVLAEVLYVQIHFPEVNVIPSLERISAAQATLQSAAKRIIPLAFPEEQSQRNAKHIYKVLRKESTERKGNIHTINKPWTDLLLLTDLRFSRQSADIVRGFYIDVRRILSAHSSQLLSEERILRSYREQAAQTIHRVAEVIESLLATMKLCATMYESVQRLGAVYDAVHKMVTVEEIQVAHTSLKAAQEELNSLRDVIHVPHLTSRVVKAVQKADDLIETVEKMLASIKDNEERLKKAPAQVQKYATELESLLNFFLSTKERSLFAEKECEEIFETLAKLPPDLVNGVSLKNMLTIEVRLEELYHRAIGKRQSIMVNDTMRSDAERRIPKLIGGTLAYAKKAEEMKIYEHINAKEMRNIIDESDVKALIGATKDPIKLAALLEQALKTNKRVCRALNAATYDAAVRRCKNQMLRYG